MKKNYIAPSTVAATWASMGIMNPEIGMSSASGGTSGPVVTDSVYDIE